MYIADFILDIWGGLIFRIKFFPEFFFDRTVCLKQGGMPSQEGGTEVTTPGGCLVCQAHLMNSFFNLWMVATDTLVSFDVTLML